MTRILPALALAALLLPAAALAADKPISQQGSWRLNVKESDQGSNPNPILHSEQEVPKDDGNALEWTLVEHLKDGSKREMKWVGAYDGKLRPANDYFHIAYAHTPNGWRDWWEVVSGPAKGTKGWDDCTMSPDGKKQSCKGGLEGQPTAYTMVMDRVK